MISSYPRTATITTVDCEKQVRSWRLLRSLVELLIPTCNCTFVEDQENQAHHKNYTPYFNYHRPSSSSSSSLKTIITGTIFGYRRGKVSFCIQNNPNSSTSILLLELDVSTSTLASEMRGGVVRIALESGNDQRESLLRMYCNGKKVGFAIKRKPTKADLKVLGQMQSVDIGAGIIHGKEIKRDDDIMYLRGKFERVYNGFHDSESFHLIDPEGSMGQELSIYFLRSRC